MKVADEKDVEERNPFIITGLDCLAKNIDRLEMLLKVLDNCLTPVMIEQQLVEEKSLERSLESYSQVTFLLMEYNHKIVSFNVFLNQLIKRIEL